MRGKLQVSHLRHQVTGQGLYLVQSNCKAREVRVSAINDGEHWGAGLRRMLQEWSSFKRLPCHLRSQDTGHLSGTLTHSTLRQL